MRVFVAGASGALGSQLVPRLVARGHEVVGLTRSASKQRALANLGATPVVADALDRDQVVRAVAAAEPEAIVHELTALSGALGTMRNVDRAFALTNRLRTEGTDNLLAAGRAAGARRFVAQSFAGWPYARTGGPVKDEDDPLDPAPPGSLTRTHAAMRHLEDAVRTAEWVDGLVLRYGGFYGPGTSMTPGGEHFELIRKRMLPLVGDGGAVWSFVHVEDAAEATAIALERGKPGTYNIVDDDPAPVAEWLPATATALGAKPPRRVPAWLGRLVGGEGAIVMMTQARGASNAKAKRELGWTPAHPSWRTGFVEAAGR